jgi:chromosome partitioning protein
MVARRLIVAMPKGGSGRTATSVAFAWGLHRAGKRVLLVDLDPQGDATAVLGAGRSSYGVEELLFRPDALFAPEVVVAGLHVVAARPWSAGIDVRAQRASQLGGPMAVGRALDRVQGSYDFIICDCAPSLGPVTCSALLAGPILVPVETTRLAVSVLPEFQNVVAQFVRGAASWGGILAYLPTRYVSGQVESSEALAALHRIGGSRVLRTRVPLATAVARSLAEGIPLFDRRYRRSMAPRAYRAALAKVTRLLEARHGEAVSVPELDRGEASQAGSAC